jgi:HlyD family secretion protein
VQGTLRQLAPTVDPKTRYAIAYVDLPAGSAARAGMFAQGYFDLAQTEALTVPQEAVVMRDGFAHVLIVGADRRVSLKRVQTGRMVENRMEIREGLLPEQTVAVRGAAFLNDGDLVQISADGSAASSVNTLPVSR